MARRLVSLLVVVCLAGCTGLFFQPMPQHVHSPTDAGVAFRDIALTANDGVRLHAWVLPAQGEARGVVVFLHGNAENISTHVASVLWLPARGYHVVVPDYRGYGRSEGKPSLDGVLRDVDAATAYAADPVNFDGLPVVLFGQSLGGALALVHAGDPAHRARLAGVISDSAFSGFRDIAREKLRLWWVTRWIAWPLGWLVDDDARPADAVARIAPVPLLLIHGDRDVVIPVQHASRLFDAASAPKTLWIAPGVGHIESMRSPEMRDRFARYLDGLVARP